MESFFAGIWAVIELVNCESEQILFSWLVVDPQIVSNRNLLC